MVNLRGHFAIILLLEAEEAEISRLRRGVQEEGRRIGLSVMVAEGEGVPAAGAGLPFKLKTYSLDQPGLVHKITAVLRGHGVNIEELSARQESAAFAGTMLFVMEMRLTVPANMAVRTLRGELERECAALNCDMDLEPG
jgi:glycine cleavage system transcriptional repressor